LTTCEKGRVWDGKDHRCVVKHSGVLPDRDLTEYAFASAKVERFDEALDVLDTLQDPNTARALNYRGYLTRRLGRTEGGISYYLRSVALDPDYTQVREYLGDAYVTLGRFNLAQEQLAMIGKLCGSIECEEYEDLNDAIRTGNVESISLAVARHGPPLRRYFRLYWVDPCPMSFGQSEVTKSVTGPWRLQRYCRLEICFPRSRHRPGGSVRVNFRTISRRGNFTS